MKENKFKLKESRVSSRHVKTCIQETHPKYDGTKPMTVRDMLMRATNGLPISVPQHPNDRLPVNRNKFFQDNFDIIDVVNNDLDALKAKIKASKDRERAERERQYNAFLKWQKEQNMTSETISKDTDKGAI